MPAADRQPSVRRLRERRHVAEDVVDPPRGLPGGRFAHWHVDPPPDRDEDSWLLVYLDVMTLLLVMLVVLLAFSNRDSGVRLPAPQPAPELAQPHLLEGLPGLLDGLPVLPPIPDTGAEPPPLPSPDDPAVDPLAGLALEGLGEDVEVLVVENAVSFRISNEILFASGQAELSPRGFEVIDQLAEVLRDSYHRVAVEGHTDDVPIQTVRFPSNWELSTGRATSVVRRLEAGGVDSARLRATGFADTRPLADNATAEGRASNRRVELILETVQ